MKKAVFFDLDGTLLDTLQDLADSTNEMLRFFNMPERSIDEIRHFVGNGMVKLIERSVSSDFDKNNFEEAYEFFRNAYRKNMRNNTRPYEGIIDVLKRLKEAGMKIFVTSNKNDDAVKGLCNEVFPSLLDEAVGVNENNPPKPNSKMIDNILEKYGLDIKDCIFVGDSETDILTAKNAKMESIGVLWGFRDESVLISQGADFIIEKPCEIADIVI